MHPNLLSPIIASTREKELRLRAQRRHPKGSK
jgi:hypothetical protein